MKILEKLNLDTWWSVVLYLGVLSCIGASTLQINFISEKHLFGLGIGLILIGVAHLIAYRNFSEFKPANAYTGGPGLLQWNAIKHSIPSIVLFVLGIIVSAVFGFLIIMELI